ncbi:MAG: hypothetical protein E6K78_05130 [Candidatus Eisenbacteria bacterium]|uniref:Cytochrome c-552/4 domain-containing protein n=1 Tax=Eiseniibacteriota bacterium TaxID=2212470 RepID=A0A538TUN8_UNCEI|nr:MAG: hypothetical protein E6K78_05130 [Candidatus Eisenbacteria bacterium]
MPCPRPWFRAAMLVACAATMCAGCGRGPEFRYTIDLRQPDSGSVQVTLNVVGAPPNGLTLRTYASKDLIRLSDLVALTPDGTTLSASMEPDTTGSAKGTQLVRFVGRIPSRLSIRYRVRPGARYGDAHMGYEGRCFGYLDRRFGFLNGQNLFLTPRDLESIERVSVRFALPEGWTAVTPWMQQGDLCFPGVNGRYVGEHLISGVVGVGHFHERNLVLDGTRYRFAFESGFSAEDEEQAMVAIERVTRYTHSIVPGDGPREYIAVIVPAAPFGDEIDGNGWTNGQGGTLAPPTGLRLRQYARRLIEARLTDAPFRRTIRDPRELWVIDGVRELCSWRAIAHAGYADEGEIARDYGAAYTSSLRLEGEEWNLERLYSTALSNDVGRRTAAPLLLLLLDRELRGLGAKGGLDSVLASMFRERRVRSLWRSLPREHEDVWRRFRDEYARAKRPFPSQELFGLSPLTPSPSGAFGKASRKLFVAFTGSTQGYLENCGCKVNQSGGVARRTTELGRLRREHPGAIVIDAGDAFMRPERGALDYLSQEEERLYLQIMNRMRYTALTVGMNELMLGSRSFDDAAGVARLPYTVANVKPRSGTLGPEWKLIHTGSLRVAVVGLFEPPRGTLRVEPYDRHAVEWRIEDPLQALRRLCPALKARADVIIAMGRITPFTIRRLAQACPYVDLMISTEQGAVLEVETNGKNVLTTEDRPGFVGHTYLAYTQLTSYGLSGVELALDHRDRVVAAEERSYWLDDKVPDDAVVRDVLGRFYERVGRTEAAQASVRVPFANDPERMMGRYVGSARCATCHPSEFAQWRMTPHASAFKTLLDVHRHYQPRCVACHVVGFGARTGYRMGDPTLALANVQCEVCHGPGGGHSDAPDRSNIRRQVPPGVCLQCHDSEHSDRFIYQERLPRVLHTRASTTLPRESEPIGS